MISYNEAKNILISIGDEYTLGTVSIQTIMSSGYVCAKAIEAPITVQPFDNSAMDGFAFSYDDLVDVAESNPVILNRVLVIAAGDSESKIEIKSGDCVQIMTGAVVPKGVDTVVPVELVSIDGDKIIFTQKPKLGDHIRKAGEDFQVGQPVLKVGDAIGPQHIMAMATLGISTVEVFNKPQVAFLATGKELVDDLSKELKSGQIYNSNAPYAYAALTKMGAICDEVATINDNQSVFEKKLHDLMAQNMDIIISSGAVSAGEFDFVKKSLENIGAEILFHKVLIKPGKPILFAKLPNGSLYFGLPGNPAASSAGLRFFVDPILRAMRSQEQEKTASAKLLTPFSKKKDLCMFIKARAESWDDGLLTVDFLGGQASFMVSPFLQMNCWAVAQDDCVDFKVGDIVDLYPLWPEYSLI